jgi:hypothetical protein
MARPHFIIIGAMKCATSSLHEQLALQPGIFMSTPKEPNFFSNDEIYAKGFDWYASLFDGAADGDLCGESSTHYTKLPTYPHTIERMVQHLGTDLRLIYVMRHPIDRLVSQYVHEWSQRVIDIPIDEAIDEHPELIAYSRYTMQLEPFIETYGRERILPVFHDHVSKHPQAVLDAVCRFIGYDKTPVWQSDEARANVSSERLRTSPLRDALVFNPVVNAVRRTLVPQGLRDWIKGFWQMKERPTLADANVQRLRDLFNEDLSRLGRWFGIDLSCDNFRDVAATTMPRWTNSEPVHCP